jgi:hypothetical protein
MTKIARGYAVPEFQCCHTDQQIGEREANAFCLVLAVDLADTKCDRCRDLLNGQGKQDFVDELKSLGFSLKCVGSGRTMG